MATRKKGGPKGPNKKELSDASKQLRAGHSSAGYTMDMGKAAKKAAAKKAPSKRPKK